MVQNEIEMKIRSGLAAIDEVLRQRAENLERLQQTDAQIATLRRDEAEVRQRVERELEELALLTSEPPLEPGDSQQKADEIHRELQFLQYRRKGLARIIEQAESQARAASGELKTLWLDLGRQSLQAALRKYCEATSGLELACQAVFAAAWGYPDLRAHPFLDFCIVYHPLGDREFKACDSRLIAQNYNWKQNEAAELYDKGQQLCRAIDRVAALNRPFEVTEPPKTEALEAAPAQGGCDCCDFDGGPDPGCACECHDCDRDSPVLDENAGDDAETREESQE